MSNTAAVGSLPLSLGGAVSSGKDVNGKMFSQWLIQQVPQRMVLGRAQRELHVQLCS